jgi:hypothetical protein
MKNARDLPITIIFRPEEELRLKFYEEMLKAKREDFGIDIGLETGDIKRYLQQAMACWIKTRQSALQPPPVNQNIAKTLLGLTIPQ